MKGLFYYEMNKKSESNLQILMLGKHQESNVCIESNFEENSDNDQVLHVNGVWVLFLT